MQFHSQPYSVRYLGGFAVLFLLFSSCGSNSWTTEESWQKTLAREWNSADPEWVSFNRPDWAEDVPGYQRYLRDLSAEGQSQRAQRARETLLRLPADTAGWSIPERAQLEAAQDYLAREAERGDYWLAYDPLSPTDGWLVSLTSLLIAGHTMVLSEDADFYLGRLQLIPQQAQEVRQVLAARQQAGMHTHPLVRAAADSLLQQWINYPPTRHPWYRSYARKMGGMDPTEMNETRATRNLISASTFIQKRINPELVQLLSQLRADTAGFIPPSPETYQHWLWYRGGTRTAPQDLHALATERWQYWDSIWETLPPKPAYQATRPGIDDPLLVLRQQMRGEGKKVLGMFSEIPQIVPYLIRWEASGSGFGPSFIPAALDGTRKETILLPPEIIATPEGFLSTYALGIPGSHLAQAGPDSVRLGHLSWPNPAWEAGWEAYSLGLLDRELGVLSTEPALWRAYVGQGREAALALILDTGYYGLGWSDAEASEALQRLGATDLESLSRLQLRVHSSPGQAAARVWGETFLQSIRQEIQGDATGMYLPPYHARLLELWGLPMQDGANLWKARHLSTLGE